MPAAPLYVVITAGAEVLVTAVFGKEDWPTGVVEGPAEDDPSLQAVSINAATTNKDQCVDALGSFLFFRIRPLTGRLVLTEIQCCPY